MYHNETRNRLFFKKTMPIPSAPIDVHWCSMNRLLRYLRGTASHGFPLHKSDSLDLVAYIDADWAACIDDRRITSGWCIYLIHSLVSWKSRMYMVVLRSSTMVELMSLAQTVSKVIWIKNVIVKLNIKLICIPTIYCDNNISVGYLERNHILHSRENTWI